MRQKRASYPSASNQNSRARRASPAESATRAATRSKSSRLERSRMRAGTVPHSGAGDAREPRPRRPPDNPRDGTGEAAPRPARGQSGVVWGRERPERAIGSTAAAGRVKVHGRLDEIEVEL